MISTRARRFYGVSAVGLMATLFPVTSAGAAESEPEVVDPTVPLSNTVEITPTDPAVEAYLNYLFHQEPPEGVLATADHSADRFTGVCSEHTHTHKVTTNAVFPGGIRFFSSAGEISFKDKCYGGITSINFKRIHHDVTGWGSLNLWSYGGVVYNDARYFKWRNHPKGGYEWTFRVKFNNANPGVGDMHHTYKIHTYMNGGYCYLTSGGSRECPVEY